MEFQYIVYRWFLGSKKKKMIAGFTNLNTAKDFGIMAECSYFSNSFLYIVSPEGRYIQGEYNNKSVWFKPGETAFVYDAEKDRVIRVSEHIEKLILQFDGEEGGNQ